MPCKFGEFGMGARSMASRSAVTSEELDRITDWEKTAEKMVRFSTDEKHQITGKASAKTIGRSPGKRKKLSENRASRRKWILDPGGKIVLTWNRAFLASCLASHCIDPLFFFLPMVDNTYSYLCMRMDKHLAVTLTYLRSLVDMLYFIHIAARLCTAYVDPVSKVLGKGELVTNPDMLVWAVSPSMSFRSINAPFFLIILIQSAIRLYANILLCAKIVKAAGFIAKNAWEGAMYNLLLYLIASHLVGAIYYLLTVERQKTCWESQCLIESQMANQIPCDFKFLDCRHATSSENQNWANSTSVFTNCDVQSQNVSVNFGIFIQAMQNGVATISLSEKYFFSLWWGLQQLTTYGNPLVTSSFIGENLFAIGLTVFSIGLFAQLIGSMQIYMRSLSMNVEWRIRQTEMEDWMRDRQIPDNIQHRISQFFEYKWIATQGVEEDAILIQLPADLRREIKQHLCLDLVRRVPFFSEMDQQLQDAICERMTSFLRAEGTYIIREGDPVKEMLFIIRGQLESSTTDGGRTDFFNCLVLKSGDFCGEELLTWALVPSSGDSYPSSTRTVRTITELEAFSLRADDLKFVASTFRMLHSKHLQHTFRFYSYQWRTWAARFIQSSWRRRQNRQQMAEVGLSSRWESFFSLVGQHINEARHDSDGSSDSVAQEGSVTVLKIASIFRKAQKERPEEPDFSADDDSE